jgi:Cu(I)/Ag(I) efflux system membrane fusion protein
LSKPVREQLKSIAQHSEHLHHMTIEAARLDAFRPISHAIITLASRVRSGDAKQPFSHMFCPMVKRGGGDWLQPNADLKNPYFGSQMLTCGDVVQELPTVGDAAGNVDGKHQPPVEKE